MSAFPTSKDIYLEVNGVKVAVVQSYSAKAVKTSSSIEAFGEKEPVATIAGPTNYTIELERIYATDNAISDGLNFYDLEDFSLVICKPDRRIIYTDCSWKNIEEQGRLGNTALEHVTVVAARRIETSVA